MFVWPITNNIWMTTRGSEKVSFLSGIVEMRKSGGSGIPLLHFLPRNRLGLEEEEVLGRTCGGDCFLLMPSHGKYWLIDIAYRKTRCFSVEMIAKSIFACKRCSYGNVSYNWNRPFYLSDYFHNIFVGQIRVTIPQYPATRFFA